MEAEDERRVTARRRLAPAPPLFTNFNVAHGGGGSNLEFRDWSSLTDLLLLSVLRCLNSLEDFFAFRGVCRTWRSLASPSPSTFASQPPLLLVSRFPSHSRAFFDLSRRRLYRFVLPWNSDTRETVDYSNGHIISITRHRRPKPLLWNLFTGSFTRLPRAPKRFCRALLSAHPDSPDCLVVLFHYSVLQFFHPGDRLWTLLHCSQQTNPQTLIIDALFLEERLFALTADGHLAVVELNSRPELVVLQTGADALAELDMSQPDRWLLANCDGDLLALYLPIEADHLFLILRWEFEKGGWSPVSSLGGRALFMNSRGFAASIVPSCPEVKSDCVYFLPRCRSEWAVYSLLDGSLEVVGADAPGLCVGLPYFIPNEIPIWVIPSNC